MGVLVNVYLKRCCRNQMKQSISYLLPQLFYTAEVKYVVLMPHPVHAIPGFETIQMSLNRGCILKRPHVSILSYTQFTSPTIATSSESEIVTQSFKCSSIHGA